MKVVPIDSIPIKDVPHVREGVFRMQTLLTGDPASPGNFALMLVRTPDTYYSPRHRHNFDQVRYQLEGEFDFTTDGIMGPGMIGYFPEGTRYGPQDTNSASFTLVLQFGGDSGSGYLSREQYDAAAETLSKKGQFAKGVYTTVTEDGRKHNKDAYEAIWEEVHGRPLVYPDSGYEAPVFITPDELPWTASSGNGVEKRDLGRFTVKGTRLAQWRIPAGQTLTLEDNSLYFVEAGKGEIDGQACRKHSTAHLTKAEVAVYTAGADSVLLQIGLPDLQ